MMNEMDLLAYWLVKKSANEANRRNREVRK